MNNVHGAGSNNHSYFVSTFSSCCFLELLGFGNWSYSLNVSVNRRANNAFNHCPKSLVAGVVTVHYVNDRILAYVPVFDADQDLIRCRYATDVAECGSICQSQIQAPFALSSSSTDGCIFVYTGSSAPSYYVVWPMALVIEDYETTTSTTPMCMMPVQIAVEVSNNSFSKSNCTLYSGSSGQSSSVITTASEPPLTSRWWFWLIIVLVVLLIVVILLLIAAVVVMCIISKKKKRVRRIGQAPDSDSEPDSPRPSERTYSNTFGLKPYKGPADEDEDDADHVHPEVDTNGQEWNWAGIQAAPRSDENDGAFGHNASKAEQATGSAFASSSTFYPPPPPPEYSTARFDPNTPPSTQPNRDFNLDSNPSSRQQRPTSGDQSAEPESEEVEIVRRDDAI